MQPGKQESLAALYAQALSVGAELLALVSGAPSSGALDRVAELLQERGRIAELTGGLVAEGDVPPDALPLLRQVVEQQAAIASGLGSSLAEVQSRQLSASAQRGKVRGTQNLLTTGPRSRLLNEYR